MNIWCVKINTRGSDYIFLLPLTQDIEIWKDDNNNEVHKNVSNKRKLNFYDYVYIMNENELLKLKIELDHMDVVNALEKYIDTQKSFDNVILSEKEAKDTKVPLKFLYYLGKYRLENNLFKTKNYLAPIPTEFLHIITNKYNNGIVDSTDLYNLDCIMTDANIDEDIVTKELINNLFNSVNIEIVDKFQIDKEELNNTINNIKNILKDNRECQDTLCKLKWLLERTEINVLYMYGLGLQDKLDSVITQGKQKVK